MSGSEAEATAKTDYRPYVAVFALVPLLLSLALNPFFFLLFVSGGGFLLSPLPLFGAALAAGLMFLYREGRAPIWREVLRLSLWSLAALMLLSLAGLGLGLVMFGASQVMFGAEMAGETGGERLIGGEPVILLLAILLAQAIKAAFDFVLLLLCYGPLLQLIQRLRTALGGT